MRACQRIQLISHLLDAMLGVGRRNMSVTWNYRRDAVVRRSRRRVMGGVLGINA